MFVGRDLEQYVETLRTDSSPAVSQRSVKLKEVEEGAVSLRKVGENLAGLKGKTLKDFAFLLFKMASLVTGSLIFSGARPAHTC